MECHFCNQKREGLPFRCNFCGESFCSDHRLPENHACPRVGGPKQPGHSEVIRYRPNNSERGAVPFVRSGRSRFRFRYTGIFSKVEEKHVVAASLVVALSGVLTNWMIAPSPLVNPSILFFTVAIPAYILCFLGHEISHKFIARRNGMWVEFRTTLYGLLLTAVSSVFLVKFLAPGQIEIHGNGSKETVGGIALVGPSFNIAVGALSILVSGFLGTFFGPLLVEIAWFNAWMATINLIPLGSLDGSRVYKWDKTRWAIALAASIFIVILSYYYFYRN